MAEYGRATADAEVASLREQVRALTNERDTLKAQLETTHGHVAEVARLLGADVMPDAWGLKSAAEKRLAEVRALTADNAALLGLAVHSSECRATESMDCTPDCPLGRPHPGAALLEEIRALTAERDEARDKHDEALGVCAGLRAGLRNAEADVVALRARVAELEEDKALWATRERLLQDEADHLRGVVQDRTQDRDAAQRRVRELEVAASKTDALLDWLAANDSLSDDGRERAQGMRRALGKALGHNTK